MIYNKKLYGAIYGDIMGSIYEFKPLIKGSDANYNPFEPMGHYTDDSLLTIAIADSILHDKDTVQTIKDWAIEYDAWNNHLGFGGNFHDWIYGTFHKDPNDSWGNGALMRVSPYMWKQDRIGARNSTNGSHEHQYSRDAVNSLFDLYHLEQPSDYPLVELIPFNELDESSMGTIEIIRKLFPLINNMSTVELVEATVKLNGDCDTNASIIGELSNYHQKDLDDNVVEYVRSKLDQRQLNILDKFNAL